MIAVLPGPVLEFGGAQSPGSQGQTQARLFPGRTWISNTTFMATRLCHVGPSFGQHLAPKQKGGDVRMWIEMSLEKLSELHGNEKEEGVGEDTDGHVRQSSTRRNEGLL